MHSWRTNDEVTNTNLRSLENLSRPWPGLNAEQFVDRIRSVIMIEKMLPTKVRQHFDLPALFVGNRPYDWSQERLDQESEALCNALKDGLEKTAGDPDLMSPVASNRLVRPRSRGEQVRLATEAFANHRNQEHLTALRYAVSGTHLQSRMDRLDKWLGRKRPSPGGRSLEYEIVCAIGDIKRYADELHYMPATDSYRPVSEP